MILLLQFPAVCVIIAHVITVVIYHVIASLFSSSLASTSVDDSQFPGVRVITVVIYHVNSSIGCVNNPSSDWWFVSLPRKTGQRIDTDNAVVVIVVSDDCFPSCYCSCN